MLIMEPNGSIEPATPGPTAADSFDKGLERVVTFTEDLGNELTNEVRAIVDTRLASLAARLGPVPNTAGWSMAG